MNVLMINGSRRAKGCTYTALTIVAEELEAEGIGTRIVHVTDADAVDQALAALDTADGLVLGTPVYWASPTGEIETFMDKLWGRAKRPQLAGKPCAVLASARRGGTTASLDALAKYPEYAEMPLVSSCYWNMVHGNKPEEVWQGSSSASRRASKPVCPCPSWLNSTGRTSSADCSTRSVLSEAGDGACPSQRFVAVDPRYFGQVECVPSVSGLRCAAVEYTLLY